MSYPARFVEFFGPSLWKSLHSIAFSAPEKPSLEEQRDYVEFFRALGPVIPCPSCAAHYRAYLEANPVDASSREALARWVYDLHDFVNQRKNKKSPSFEAVRDHYAGWSQTRHAKLAATAARERVLASPIIEDATAEEARVDTAAVALVSGVALALGAAAYGLYARRSTKNEGKK
jgi:hypothetical protein